MTCVILERACQLAVPKLLTTWRLVLLEIEGECLGLTRFGLAVSQIWDTKEKTGNEIARWSGTCNYHLRKFTLCSSFPFDSVGRQSVVTYSVQDFVEGLNISQISILTRL